MSSARFLGAGLLALGLMAGSAGTLPAAMATEATGIVGVNMNMARILRIPSAAATVIIGNPGVADVTIQDPQTLVLTGKSYGRTNLIALDAQGDPITDMLIEVTRDVDDLLTVYEGGARQTFACAPECQPIIITGDDNGFTATTLGSAQIVAGAAQ